MSNVNVQSFVHELNSENKAILACLERSVSTINVHRDFISKIISRLLFPSPQLFHYKK